MSILEFRLKIYSQNGEDGVLQELLRRIGLGDNGPRWCVEFGAWDGMYLSNTFNLVKSFDWNAVYIEGDPEKYPALEKTAAIFPRIRPIQGLVGASAHGGRALDEYLSTTEIPIDYDLLSIDIDSSDLDAWAHHTAYQPKIVIIEINSSIAPGILQWHGNHAQGNSFSSTLNVAAAKGYTLVCHTGNLILVRNDLVDLVGINPLDRLYPERLFLWDWVHSAGHVPVTIRLFRLLPKSLRDILKKLLR